MALWELGDRGVCAALMLIGAVLLAVRLPPRVARAAWLGLLVAGIAYALFLNLLPRNLINGNLVHYYLGAKYTVPYRSFYSSIQAALDEPEIGIRDLGQPDRLLRATPSEERAYYIDLMREEGVEFDPLTSLPNLRMRAFNTGVLRQISRRNLSENLPAAQLDDFRRDVRWATDRNRGRPITRDFGFNGSPFYVLVRHIDPTLYQPIGPMTAWLNLTWQILALLALAWLTGIALGLDVNGRIAMAALVFASWDVIGWALLGLILAGLWLPLAIALYSMHRRAAAPTGIAIAWAGLIKLFPFILLLPAAARLVRVGVRRVSNKRTNGLSHPWLKLLVWCAVGTGVLGFAAEFSGRSWLDFLDKITVQFTTKGATANNVSLSRGLWALGIEGLRLSVILSVVSVAALAALFLRGTDEDAISALPRRSLVLLAATGWVAPVWLNYYSVAPLLLLPLVARRHRVGALVAAMAMALAFVLPEFTDPLLVNYPSLRILKLAPYLLVPAWMVFLEFRPTGLPPRARPIAAAVGVLCVLATAGGAWRMHAITKLAFTASEYSTRGDAKSALQHYQRFARLSPRSALAYMGMAVAHQNLGDLHNARSDFEHAIRLSPDDAPMRMLYGRLLATTGSMEEAAQQFEIALRLRPFDQRILFDLARARLGLSQRARAEALLIRAHELQPANKDIRALLTEVQRGSP